MDPKKSLFPVESGQFWNSTNMYMQGVLLVAFNNLANLLFELSKTKSKGLDVLIREPVFGDEGPGV